MNLVVHQSSIHYERIYDVNNQLIGNLAHVSIFYKSIDSISRTGRYFEQIDYNVTLVERAPFEDDEHLMHLEFTVYSMVDSSDSYYEKAVSYLFGDTPELYFLSPYYGEGVIANNLQAGEITALEAEAQREYFWQIRAQRDIGGHAVIAIVEGIVGYTPAV